MLRVGLTGGVACGKTTVAEMLRRRGAHIIYADEIAHQLLAPGQPVYQEVVKAFGPGILQADGQIDRAKLAEAAFGAGRVKELNRIVHPPVIARQEQWMAEVGRKDAHAIAVVEAALILEAGVGRRFGKLVVVTCKPEQKAERYAARHKISLEAAQAEVARRSAVQLPDSEKAAAAHFLIDNSGTRAETERQVEKLFAELQELARQP
ncbi:MAG TPA: dephospho-CoA kinase [Terriglobales bacterium]|nr:dephospho-CoA kinase [Terriglobales bacterium]